MNVTKVYNEMDYEADERLLRDNLHQDPPMHIRRTLDQSYFLTLDDTGARDRDQVVYRETKAGRSFHMRNTRVVMVDQLWLWILDDSKITLFPVSLGTFIKIHCPSMSFEAYEGLVAIEKLPVIIIPVDPTVTWV